MTRIGCLVYASSFQAGRAVVVGHGPEDSGVTLMNWKPHFPAKAGFVVPCRMSRRELFAYYPVMPGDAGVLVGGRYLPAEPVGRHHL